MSDLNPYRKRDADLCKSCGEAEAIIQDMHADGGYCVLCVYPAATMTEFEIQQETAIFADTIINVEIIPPPKKC